MCSKKPDIASLNKMAKETNSFPLPHIPENPHILLPPPEHSLIRNNFHVYSEDLANMLNNPYLDQEEKYKLEDLERLRSYNKKGKSRQSMIGIKRHTERNTERLSISSNFKKRKTDLGESQNGNHNNNKNKIHHSSNNNTNNIFKNADNNSPNNFNNENGNGTHNYIVDINKQRNLNNVNFSKGSTVNNKGAGNATNNRKRLDSSDANMNDEEDKKSDNQDFGDNEYNNEEGDVDDYDHMENQSENSEGNFGLRDEFNHSDMGDYL